MVERLPILLLQVHHFVCYAAITMCVANGIVTDLKIIPSDRDDPSQNIVCPGDRLRWMCSTSGSRLRWLRNGSIALTFTLHTPRVLHDGKLTAILLNMTYNTSDDVWQFTSELHSSDTASSISQPITCATNSRDQRNITFNLAGMHKLD